jgi:elongation of very long chain fatty acids protein 4
MDFACLNIDPRTKDWYISNSLGQTLGILSTYLLVVWLGPKVMRSMKPFELKKVIITYNALMVAFNAYVFYLVSLLKLVLIRQV